MDEQKRWDKDKIVDYIVWLAGFSIGLIIIMMLFWFIFNG